MSEPTSGKTGNPGGAESGQPLQTVGEALGADLDFIASLIDDTPTPSAPVQGNDKPEAATTPVETPEPTATGERSDPEGTEPAGNDTDEGGLPPELQARIDKRIGKEVAKTKSEREAREAAEAKLAEMEARLAEANQAAGPATATTSARPNRLGTLTTPEQCAQYLEQAEGAMDWAEAMLVRIEDQPEEALEELVQAKVDLGQEPTVGKARAFLTRLRLNTNRIIQREIPQRLQYLHTEQTANQQAETVFPWWKDKASHEYQEAQKVLTGYPEIRQRPHWKMVVGTYVEGIKAVQARQQAKPATRPLPKPQPGAPAAAAPERETSAAAKVRAAQERWAKNPNDRQAQEAYLELLELV